MRMAEREGTDWYLPQFGSLKREFSVGNGSGSVTSRPAADSCPFVSAV